jgi:hypothetical protein
MDTALIHRLAREAGVTQLDSGPFLGGPTRVFLTWEDLARFAALVAEDCARICETGNPVVVTGGPLTVGGKLMFEACTFRETPSPGLAQAIRTRFANPKG